MKTRNTIDLTQTSGVSPGKTKNASHPPASPEQSEFRETHKKIFRSMNATQDHADFLRSRHSVASTPNGCDLCGQFHLTTAIQIPSMSPPKFTLGDRVRMKRAILTDP